MKFDIQILETVLDIVIKFYDQTSSVEEVITIPVLILKKHAACLFIRRTNNTIIIYIIHMAEVCDRDIPRERLKCVRELLLHGPEVAEVVQGYCTVDMKAMHMVASKPARSKTSRSPC